jgi:hypothetical protein
VPHNAKAAFNFADGTVRVEGSQAFVTDCMARFASGGERARASPQLLQEAIDHGWEWFSLHATHRMQAVNFFLLASAFLSAAYVSALRFTYPLVAVGVAALGVGFSVCFNRFELRIQELLRAGEAALAPAQGMLAEVVRLPEIRICERVEKPQRRFTAYSSVIRALHWVTAVGFLGGVIYAAYLGLRRPLRPSAHDELLVLLTYRSVVVLAAVAILHSARNLAAGDRTTLNWFRYAIAFALASAGIVTLLLSVLRPLR